MPALLLMGRPSADLKFLTLDEAADILQVSKRTIQRMVRNKTLCATRVGRQWRIRESELLQWVKQNENLNVSGDAWKRLV
jgi:excisionase family DNA binding protein